MKRPNRKDYINKATKSKLIADLELYIDYLEDKIKQTLEEDEDPFGSLRNALNNQTKGKVCTRMQSERNDLCKLRAFNGRKT